MNRRVRFGAFVAGAVALLALAIAAPPGRIAGENEAQTSTVSPGEVHRDVPYVPTRPATVAEMLRMARVDAEDLVYDLGSGDGRIVITAAREHGARGVGIDIDPVRIREANANAAAAGVADRVRFIEGDLFETDLRDATAVTLYLLPEVNVRLRPKLLAELRPGTPVVSHDFGMGDWVPDERRELETDVLMLWIIPAKVEGTWTWTDAENRERRLSLTQTFQKVSGSVAGGARGLVLHDALLDGDQIALELAPPGGKAPVVERYRGRVAVDTIYGTVERNGRTEPWTARRE